MSTAVSAHFINAEPRLVRDACGEPDANGLHLFRIHLWIVGSRNLLACNDGEEVSNGE